MTMCLACHRELINGVNRIEGKYDIPKEDRRSTRCCESCVLTHQFHAGASTEIGACPPGLQFYSASRHPGEETTY